MALLPNIVKELEKLLVVFEVAELTVFADIFAVILDIEVGWRSNCELDRFIIEHGQVACVTLVEVMVRWEAFHGMLDLSHPFFITGKRRNLGFQVGIGKAE